MNSRNKKLRYNIGKQVLSTHVQIKNETSSEERSQIIQMKRCRRMGNGLNKYKM